MAVEPISNKLRKTDDKLPPPPPPPPATTATTTTTTTTALPPSFLYISAFFQPCFPIINSMLSGAVIQNLEFKAMKKVAVEEDRCNSSWAFKQDGHQPAINGVIPRKSIGLFPSETQFIFGQGYFTSFVPLGPTLWKSELCSFRCIIT